MSGERFEIELTYIQNPIIREFVIDEIKLIPDYFWVIPSSSTGKYHPPYALGEGGLYRHTRATILIALELFRLEDYLFSADEQDIIIASLILHDTRKNGIDNGGNTVSTHPAIMDAVLLSHKEKWMGSVMENWIDRIRENILTHMGQWNTDYKTHEVVLPKPESRMQKFVHLCDYLASRKCLEVNLTLDK